MATDREEGVGLREAVKGLRGGGVGLVGDGEMYAVKHRERNLS